MHIPNLQALIDTAGVIRLLEADALACLPDQPGEAVFLASVAAELRERPAPVRTASAGGAR